MEIRSKVMEAGATPVDIYPILHCFPQRIFGRWRDRATHVQRSMDTLYASLLAGIRARRTDSGPRGSVMDEVLSQVEGGRSAPGMTSSHHELWFLGGMLTEGGSDTTASVFPLFVQAMVLNPMVQRKAQNEIDSIFGSERSPNWHDHSSLPYVT